MNKAEQSSYLGHMSCKVAVLVLVAWGFSIYLQVNLGATDDSLFPRLLVGSKIFVIVFGVLGGLLAAFGLSKDDIKTRASTGLIFSAISTISMIVWVSL